MNSTKPDSVLWEGRPDYRPRRIAFTIIGILSVSIALTISPVSSRHPGLIGLLVFLGILIAVNLSIAYMYGDTYYYITTGRIGKNRLLTGRRTEILLEDVETVTVKLRRGRGFLWFRTSDGRSLKFGLLKDDPERVRHLVLEARSAVSDKGRKRIAEASSL